MGKNIKRGFTLIEIMVVVLVIALLLMIAIPQFLTARHTAQKKTCLANLKEIEYGKEIRAIDKKMVAGDPVTMADLWPDYIRSPGIPQCPAGGTYTINPIGVPPTCSIPDHTLP